MQPLQPSATRVGTEQESFIRRYEMGCSGVTMQYAFKNPSALNMLRSFV